MLEVNEEVVDGNSTILDGNSITSEDVQSEVINSEFFAGSTG